MKNIIIVFHTKRKFRSRTAPAEMQCFYGSVPSGLEVFFAAMRSFIFFVKKTSRMVRGARKAWTYGGNRASGRTGICFPRSTFRPFDRMRAVRNQLHASAFLTILLYSVGLPVLLYGAGLFFPGIVPAAAKPGSQWLLLTAEASETEKENHSGVWVDPEENIDTEEQPDSGADISVEDAADPGNDFPGDSCTTEEDTEPEEYTWPVEGISTRIPFPSFPLEDLWTNTEFPGQFLANVTTSYGLYTAYKDACKEQGFCLEETDSCHHDEDFVSDNYQVFDAEGYRLQLRYHGTTETGTMEIALIEPIRLGTLHWPEEGPGLLLPLPPTTEGTVGGMPQMFLIVYLGNMFIDSYDSYVEECIAAGFDQIISESDTSFSAVDSDGIKLEVSYRGGGIVFLKILDPDQKWIARAQRFLPENGDESWEEGGVPLPGEAEGASGPEDEKTVPGETADSGLPEESIFPGSSSQTRIPSDENSMPGDTESSSLTTEDASLIDDDSLMDNASFVDDDSLMDDDSMMDDVSDNNGIPAISDTETVPAGAEPVLSSSSADEPGFGADETDILPDRKDDIAAITDSPDSPFPVQDVFLTDSPQASDSLSDPFVEEDPAQQEPGAASAPSDSFVEENTPQQEPEAEAVPSDSFVGENATQQEPEAVTAPSDSLVEENPPQQEPEAEAVPSDSLVEENPPRQEPEAVAASSDSFVEENPPRQEPEAVAAPSDSLSASLVEENLPQQKPEAVAARSDFLTAEAPVRNPDSEKESARKKRNSSESTLTGAAPGAAAPDRRGAYLILPSIAAGSPMAAQKTDWEESLNNQKKLSSGAKASTAGSGSRSQAATTVTILLTVMTALAGALYRRRSFLLSLREKI